MRKALPFLLAAAALLLAGCMAGPNPLAHTAARGGEAAGFWLGLWHGFAAFFTFFASVFFPKIAVYEVHNIGAWYDFGFILGVAAAFGGGETLTR